MFFYLRGLKLTPTPEYRNIRPRDVNGSAINTLEFVGEQYFELKIEAIKLLSGNRYERLRNNRILVSSTEGRW